MSHGSHLVIEIRLPRWSQRRWLAVGLVATTLVGALAVANVMWTPFVGGAKLTSAQLNANFTSLATAIDAIKQPHLVLTQGNVDLGISLDSSLSVWLPALNAPFNLGYGSQTLYFDGNNCTGNLYFDAPPGHANEAYNTVIGTIYVPTGPGQNNVNFASYNDGNGCHNQILPGHIGVPTKDTMVPNLPVVDGTQTSIQFM